MSSRPVTRRIVLAGMMSSGIVLGLAGKARAATTAITLAVETTAGKVRGTQVDGIWKFLGVPYGADTRAVRFRPPLAPQPWPGVRDCFVLGRQAPQMEGAPRATPVAINLDAEFVKQVRAAGREGKLVGNEGEDCLVLNVYTPDASPRRKRPVMVWLHGGGFAIGSSGDPQYDGTRLAHRGDVVVVGVNHRLNALGYLYLGALHDDFADSGNVGQLDIVLALQWVRDNIADFGGDPANVTIFGESGGGSKVSVLMAMPAAKGLFHKAIIQSGSGLTMLEKSAAVRHAERTLANLDVAPADVHKLQTLDYKTIIAAALAAQTAGGGTLAPMVDGRSLPSHPFTPTAPEVSRDVPLMIGTTKDEATMFMAGDPLFGTMNEEQARQRAVAVMGDIGNEGIDLLKHLRPNDAPTYWLTALATANDKWRQAILMAERKYAQHAAPVYMFRLDWETPLVGGMLRSPHGLDTALVFDNADKKPLLLGTGPEAAQVAATMSQAWIDFARRGDPSPTGATWPSYDPVKRATIIFNTTSHIVSDPDREARLFFATAVPPAATITGPIPLVAGKDEPFRGNNEQPVAGPGLPPPVLIPFGYVEEEYVVSGEVDGRAYATSLLVRKPSDPARFSGLVAVETLHARGAIPFWGTGRQTWMPGGHAWVAVASQRAALEDHSKRVNPKRYAPLHIPDVGGGAQSSSSGSFAPNAQDIFSQAIMSQVGQLLKNNDSRGPLQNMRVRKLVMGGASQTGGTTLRYIENAHAGARRPDGQPIYDGYMPMMAFPVAPLPATNVPIMHPVVECDLINALRAGRGIGLRPDSDAPDQRYRHYQLTGASHVVTRGMTDPARVSPNMQSAMRPGEQLSQFPNVPFFTAFADALVDWVMKGMAPPSAPRIEMANDAILRDDLGNARGGLRSPYVDMPTVRYIASAFSGDGDNVARRLFGIQESIPPEQLRQRYASKAAYLRQFNQQIDRLAGNRWIRREGGEKLKLEEANNPALPAR